MADLKLKDKRFKAWGRFDKILVQMWVEEKGAERLLKALVMAGKLKGEVSVLSFARTGGGGGYMLKLLGDKAFALSTMQTGPIPLPTGDKIILALPKSFVSAHSSPATAASPGAATTTAPSITAAVNSAAPKPPTASASSS